MNGNKSIIMFDASVGQILKQFEKKHKCEFENWIGGDNCGIANFNGGEYMFHLGDIVEDIRNKYPSGKIFEWYDWKMSNPDMPKYTLRNFVYHLNQLIKIHKEGEVS